MPLLGKQVVLADTDGEFVLKIEQLIKGHNTKSENREKCETIRRRKTFLGRKIYFFLKIYSTVVTESA